MNKHNLSWREIKALFELYTNCRTKLNVSNIPFFEYYLIKQKRLIKFSMGNHNILTSESGFKLYYESEFKVAFEYYFAFLEENNIDKDGRKKFTEFDLNTLIFIKEKKEELRKFITTEKTFSSKVFKSSKYLQKKPGLKKDVCKILGIDDFPDKDPINNQTRIVVDCLKPELVVLCENMNNLKMPWKTKEKNIELWYVGGNNTTILNEISERYLDLPIFYICDWDYDGLRIYSDIKEIFSLKTRQVTLLQPDSTKDAVSVDSEDHNSQWKTGVSLSGLNPKNFTEQQIDLINYLITKNLWIEEESTDLLNILEIYLKADSHK